MRVHILGICGTFMASIALLAKQLGYQVTGCDEQVYPPMSTLLQTHGIEFQEGFEPSGLQPTPDHIVVGNVIKRGNPAIEYILNHRLPFVSGPQWLAEQVLAKRWVLAVTGTHGKTTVSSMLAWILEYAGEKPGFLIGGVPLNFDISARLGDSPYFVIEADEYDSAFFDKRSKFMHFHPKTLIINNIEFDHADIFTHLDDIKLQFQHLVRTVPSQGRIIAHAYDPHISEVLAKGRWTPMTTFSTQPLQESIERPAQWTVANVNAEGNQFTVCHKHQPVGIVSWSLLGEHNRCNALAAIAAACEVGISAELACVALSQFKNVKRRLEVRGIVKGITVYDDFAHHPTAIASTLAGIRAKVQQQRIIVIMEFGSYTMRQGYHQQALAPALNQADQVFFLRPENNQWLIENLHASIAAPVFVCDDVQAIVNTLINEVKAGDHIVVMSNKGFNAIHEKLLARLETELDSEKRSSNTAAKMSTEISPNALV